MDVRYDLSREAFLADAVAMRGEKPESFANRIAVGHALVPTKN